MPDGTPHILHATADGAVITCLAIAGALVVAHPSASPVARLTYALVPLTLATAVAVCWIERLTTLLYTVPPRRRGWRGRFRERPLLRVPLYLLLYFGTSWSETALIAVQSSVSPLWLRGTAATGLLLCALPAWLLLAHPVRYYRRVRRRVRTRDVSARADASARA